MLTPEQQSLGKRATKCACFRWREGMLRYYTADGFLERCGPEKHFRVIGQIPDCTDPATIGCLMALLREVTGAAHLVAVPACFDPEGAVTAWQIRHGERIYHGASEAEAIIAGLEQKDAILENLDALLGGVTAKLRKVVEIAETSANRHSLVFGEWSGDEHTEALKEALAFFEGAHKKCGQAREQGKEGA